MYALAENGSACRFRCKSVDRLQTDHLVGAEGRRPLTLVPIPNPETFDVNENLKTLRPLPIEKSSAGQVNADLAAERAPGDRKPGEDLIARQEQLLDEAVEETFPASDPVSVKRII